MHFSLESKKIIVNDLLVLKDVYKYIHIDYDTQRNLLTKSVEWQSVSDNVSLITIPANQKPIQVLEEILYLSKLYEWGVIEPNTEYNCIKIHDFLLFTARKDSIQEYKNVVIDSAPVDKLVEIKDKNIINFIHWALMYGSKVSQYVAMSLDHLYTAYKIIDKPSSVDYKINDLCDYLIERLNLKLPYSLYEYQKNVVFVGDTILENSNLIEEYTKCLSKNVDKEALPQNIHSATKKALRKRNREVYFKNIARGLIYNKVADMFYKDIENTKQHYKVSLISYLSRYKIIKENIDLYSLTDNIKAIINFLFLLLGDKLHVGMKLCVERWRYRLDDIDIKASPLVEYTFNCEKNEVHAYSNKMIIKVSRDQTFSEIKIELSKMEGHFIFIGQGYLYLFDIVNMFRIFIKQYHNIINILSDNNAMMFVPLIRLFKG